jgi:hypothetical protein
MEIREAISARECWSTFLLSIILQFHFCFYTLEFAGNSVKNVLLFYSLFPDHPQLFFHPFKVVSPSFSPTVSALSLHNLSCFNSSYVSLLLALISVPFKYKAFGLLPSVLVSQEHQTKALPTLVVVLNLPFAHSRDPMKQMGSSK